MTSRAPRLLVGVDGKVIPQPVKTGGLSGGDWIIVEGLKGGEKVIIAGGQLLHPGMKVEIAENTHKDLAPGAQP